MEGKSAPSVNIPILVHRHVVVSSLIILYSETGETRLTTIDQDFEFSVAKGLK
jgi:hypothetical protein